MAVANAPPFASTPLFVYTVDAGAAPPRQTKQAATLRHFGLNVGPSTHRLGGTCLQNASSALIGPSVPDIAFGATDGAAGLAKGPLFLATPEKTDHKCDKREGCMHIPSACCTDRKARAWRLVRAFFPEVQKMAPRRPWVALAACKRRRGGGDPADGRGRDWLGLPSGPRLIATSQSARHDRPDARDVWLVVLWPYSEPRQTGETNELETGWPRATYLRRQIPAKVRWLLARGSEHSRVKLEEKCR